MSTLGRLLAAKEPLLDYSLQQLEEITGKRGVDAALVGEIATKAARVTVELGLDPDCQGEELYEALLARVQQDDLRLAKILGGTDPDSLDEMLPLILERINRLDMPRSGFFMKEEVAERMLETMPPPHILAKLGYSNVKDLIASESLYEIFLALRFAEDPDWLNEFIKLYQALEAKDFTTRDIVVVPFSYDKWGDIAQKFIQKKLHNVTHSKEMGAIALMPVKDFRMPGMTSKVLPLILHYFNEIRLYSAFFKLVSTKRNFGKVIVDTIIADTPVTKIVQGQAIHWRVIQRYFGKLKDESHPEIFMPHLQPEDLHYRKAEKLLFEIDPEMKFWEGLDYVGVLKSDQVVPMAFMDISLSYANQLPYTEHYLYHFRESLWNEIFARYMGQKNLEEQILRRLDNQLVKPEEVEL